VNTRIDHTNYEAYLLDRLEGNLSPGQERELEAFLLMNPHLVPDDEELPSLMVMEASLSKVEKEALKRALPPVGMPGEGPLGDMLIARLEGDLTPAQINALEAYLVEHPEHQSAERIYALTKLVPEAMGFAEKESLVRALPPVGMPSLYTAEDFLIARIEGDLNAQQEEAIIKLIEQDHSLARSWALLRHTRVQPDPKAFPHKDALKKGGKVIAIGAPRWQMALAVAASIAVLLGVGFWMLREDPQRIPQVAEKVEPANNQNKTTTTNDPLSPDKETGYPEQQVAENGVDLDDKNVAALEGPITSQQKREKDSPVQQENDVPIERPIQRDELLQLAEQKVVVPPVKIDRAVPENVEVAAVPAYTESLAEATAPAKNTKTISVRELFASTVRERVLDQPEATTAPLGMNDAVAAVDKGLKVIAGEKAGLIIDNAGGRRRTFDLRLGRNLSITAKR
jgi:hypothetical protein